jgi:hypothetical protein
VPEKPLTYCLVAAILIAAAPAFGASDMQIKDFSGISNFSRTLTFNKFNPALGSLNSIEVSLTLQINGGHFIVDNDSSGSATGTFEFGAKANFISSVPLNPALSQIQACNLQSIILDGNVGDGTNNCSPLPPDGNEYYGSTVYNSKSAYINNSYWDSYLGTDTYDILVSGFQWSNYIGIGDIEYSINPPVTVDGSVTISYDYTVPEPATITLLALGLLVSIRKNLSSRRWG